MNDQFDNNNYVKSSKLSKEKVFGSLTNGKLVFLGVIALVLSVLGPLSLFAPVPLCVAFLLYGKKRTLSLSAILAVLTIGGSFILPQFAGVRTVGFAFIVVTLVSYMTARIIWNNENPVTGLLKNGLIAFSFIALLFGALVLVVDKPVVDVLTEQITVFGKSLKEQPSYDQVIAAGGPEAETWTYIIEKPKEIATRFLEMIFAGTFVGVFFIFWMAQFMLMRNSLVWRALHDYKFTMKDLVRFKVPEGLVYILLAGMAMIPLGTHVIENQLVSVIGWNILYALGIFYFFQGFGIISDALDSFGIFGFFRSVLVILSIFMAYQAVTLMGILDLWVNFRKFLKKKNKNEGDII